MQKKIAILLSLFATTSAFAAGSYQFECSSADGKIRVTDQGRSLKMSGMTLSPHIVLDDFELMTGGGVEPNALVKGLGKRAVLSNTKESCPRDVSAITFAQAVKIEALSAGRFETVLTSLICEEIAITTPQQNCR